jgi:hypothetical protein
VPNPVYRRALTLMEADIGDELVALDATAGNCFGFNQVAPRCSAPRYEEAGERSLGRA